MALIVGLEKVVTHRIPEKEREPQLFYYELRRRADDWSLPATIEDKVAGDDLWGTMVLSLPIYERFNPFDREYEVREITYYEGKVDPLEEFLGVSYFGEIKEAFPFYQEDLNKIDALDINEIVEIDNPEIPKNAVSSIFSIVRVAGEKAEEGEGFNEKNFMQVSEDLAEELKELAGRTKKLYKFSTSMLIAAENEEQAKYKFADASSDFAANAEVEEITDEEELQKHEYLLMD